MTLLAAAKGSNSASPQFTDPRVEAQTWFDAFGKRTPRSDPFSFRYNDKSSHDFLRTWKRHVDERTLDSVRIERVVTYTDPATKLEVRVVAVAYHDFPTVEWTVYFKNNGTTDTPILGDIQALDVDVPPAPAGRYVLRYNRGTMSPPAPEDFMPLETMLVAGSHTRLVPLEGRSTVGIMPYFNLQRGDGAGVIIALGWTGSWSADFVRDHDLGLRARGGLELTHLTLHPGEEIRSPLVVLQSWRGDWIDAQNTWRRWMIAHNLPRPGGRPPQPLLAASSSAWFEEMTKADEASQLFFINRYAEEKIPLDIWWMDAGWYENNGRWQQPRSFRVDRARFPHGLRAVTDAMHARGLKSIVWFEPMRVMPDNELYRQHPEWLLTNPTPKLISKLLDLGHPEARAWLIDLVTKHIVDDGIDVYREDHCIIEMSAIWRAHDAPDRQGITENHHVTGHYAVWDELRRRFPNLVIDDCGGGGSRLDLELMRRSLPFWRSDHSFDAASNQAQTYGLASWIPYYGTATGPTQFTPYELRSNATVPILGLAWDLRDRALPYDKLRRAIADWRLCADNYLGDFYPLTPCTLAADAWVAWQFHLPESGRGVIQAFRRVDAKETVTHFKLRGLDREARYRVTNLDQQKAPQELSGKELMDSGLEFTIPENPGAGIWTYRELK
ncbi:MAG: Alpha-galactosidase [Verrucomicrobia bacterium]|nr:Alpha-galactosidase [Verrucomicrobiota bacterium]